MNQKYFEITDENIDALVDDMLLEKLSVDDERLLQVKARIEDREKKTK